jgi:transcriptional regulator of acetoin/glycerol metabolism
MEPMDIEKKTLKTKAAITLLTATLGEYDLTLRDLEILAIRAALKNSGGSVTQAATRLGIGRATLYRRISQTPDLRR